MRFILLIIKIFLSLLLSSILILITLPLERKILGILSGGKLFNYSDHTRPFMETASNSRELEELIIRVSLFVFLIIYYLIFSRLLGKFIK